MQQLSNKIKNLRVQHNLKQAELAEKLNLSKQSISNYETGYATPSVDILIALSKIFLVSTDYLLGLNHEPLQIYNLESLPDETSEHTAKITIPTHISSQYGDDLIAFEMNDNSMSKSFPIGSIVILKPQQQIETGDLAVIRLNQQSPVCKMVFFLDDETFVLKPNSYSDTYNPEFVHLLKDQFEIIGKVVFSCQSF
ncbi:MAG: helix-turn-helix domain-containing protein [Culicoidibacterales bacterium]